MTRTTVLRIFYAPKVTQAQTATPPRTPGVGADSATVFPGKAARVGEVMELCYVTERIIALWYRDDAQGVLERATNLLRGKHANNYMIFNLSSPGRRSEPNTREAGWPQGLAPGLERLCALCKELDSWLNSALNRVVVLHARGSKERLGVAVSAYMNYSSICGGSDQDLDRFAMRRFLDDKIGSLRVPSHRRYIEYFSGLLSGSLRISSSPLYLTHLTVLGVPLFEPTGCRAFLKVYEGLNPVYTSDLYSVTNAREFTVNLGGLRLRGDILIKCYHRVYSKQSRETMFALQFHTCVITENVVAFPRSELDVACDDPRCPPDSVVTLYFASDPRLQDGPVPAPTPAVPHASARHDPILHWDSYANLETSDEDVYEGRETPLSPPPPPPNNSVQTLQTLHSLQTLQTAPPRGLGHLDYTCGPIDGSLYAVVHQGTGGGARGSPLTVSMDSGISSAPPQRPSPPEPGTESQIHGDLDKLLHDMMLTVESMPDPPSEDYGRKERNEKLYTPQQTRNYGNTLHSSSCENYLVTKESSPPYYSGNEYRDSTSPRRHLMDRREEISTFDTVDFRSSPERRTPESSDTFRKHPESFSPPGHIDYIDEDIPYHARQYGQPFTYGATTDMIKQRKLSSPSLVRRVSLKGAAPVVDFGDVLGDSEDSRRAISPVDPNTPDPPPEFANSRETTKSTVEHADGLSWLRQQQMKLAARRDEKCPIKQWRQESGNRVIGELRSLQKSRLRYDGYASDSAVLDDDDENPWTPSSISGQLPARTALYTSAPASPLLPRRSSSRKYNGAGSGALTTGRPRAESVNERPFVSVKRGYELRKVNDGQSPLSSSRGISTAVPLSLTSQQSPETHQHQEQHQHQPQHQLQHQQRMERPQRHQPPRPESRSDSFVRAETLIRERRQAVDGDFSSPTTAKFPQERQLNVAEDESRILDRFQSYFSKTMMSESEDAPDGGLLAVVDRPQDQTDRTDQVNQAHQTNPTDSLSNLVRSLAEISPMQPVNRADHLRTPPDIRTDASDLANCTNTSPNQSSKAWHTTTQLQNDSVWTERSTSPGSIPVGNASRPQTPAFPVHPRTPYVNNASPTVTFAADRTYLNGPRNYNSNINNNNIGNEGVNDTNDNTNNNENGDCGGYLVDRAIYIEERRDTIRETGLPPKSPTTHRRLSFPAGGQIKQAHNKRGLQTNQSTSFDSSKDRASSPVGGLTPSQTARSPAHVEFVPSPKNTMSSGSVNSSGQISSQTHYTGSRRSSVNSNMEPQEVADANVKFVRDTSRIWYKPNISREQAISMLKDATPGTFVVRDSNSFPGAFGLALKVATPPPGAPSSPRDPSSELVRHFLIEPTSRGVRLKGCANEPVFSSLSALVYQHSLMAMALPCQLLLPEPEAAARALDSSGANSTQQLLAQGAACNVLYLFTMDTESLTGPQAIKKAVTTLFEQSPLPAATIVHFKVSTQGITLTDNARKLFFRRHYPTSNISYCGLDSEERTWEFLGEEIGPSASAHRCFGFVARKPAHKSDNQCHVFAELEPEQPATAIVNFVNKVMMGSAIIKANIV
ncbi:tensin-3 isoform X6 [Orussus abietinus]|uniref:tensin-3 isoform X6 n=1 Tax=Orussus abietinus TaxID=222816 RepID=UPI000C715E15|nr:tensin-3 isoform X6 [Orussus abietinus]